MSRPADQLSPALRRSLGRWMQRWGTPHLAGRLRVEFSPRLRRAFGRCYQSERLVRLALSLRDTQAHLLPEILCHEAAHAAVWERFGATARPHGDEWQTMMRAAGFEPRVKIPVVVDADSRAARGPSYVHRCPVCSSSRTARRPMHAWRCSPCSGGDSEGRLVIRRRAVAA